MADERKGTLESRMDMLEKQFSVMINNQVRIMEYLKTSVKKQIET